MNSPTSLSRPKALILELLDARGEMTGLQLVEAAAGVLADYGYISSREIPRDASHPDHLLPRRVFSITASGSGARKLAAPTLHLVMSEA